ncbi:potassium channel family protein [Halopiger aswanensis]|uniref:Voltage-gated potassium channel n=1 Tax=Halopiger aswanensis TaxID=148449 RepID=A0A419VWQ2_9EURY|nr:potassium channel family protein [Halopiger aswanensis]RKD87662.1 voltage-gated potassium channel [Halopiger aswanensis]
MSTRPYGRLRRQTNELFNPKTGGRIGHYIDWFIMSLIAANVAAVILETVDALGTAYADFFYWFELFSVVVFSIEYIARIWSAVDDSEYQGPITGRLKFASRPLLIIDLLAILPFYLTIGGVQGELRFLRALRLVRLFRLLKLARYSSAMQAFGAVIRQKKEKLVIAVFANGLLLVIASSVMYYIEHQHQPEAFSSIPAAFWWGVATLTTVGYGDVHPITPLGKFVGAIVAVLGIGLFALPASILASGFIEQAAAAGDDDGPTYCPHCGEKLE